MHSLEDYVNTAFDSIGQDSTVDTEKAVESYSNVIGAIKNDQFIELLITTGYIPDIYPPDSSEETLYTKLCEVIEVEWALRMGYESYNVTQKASFEDVVIRIDNHTIVSDTKTFRLSRSQLAPNVKDFVKPEDYSKWIARHSDNNPLGGLVVYPQLHEWKVKSDSYSYCSNKDNPILMLPFHYLSFILKLKFENKLNPKELIQLWDYNTIFPFRVSRRKDYWKVVNNKIIEISDVSSDVFKEYMVYCDKKLRSYTEEKMIFIEKRKKQTIHEIKNEIACLSEGELIQAYADYRIAKETDDYTTMLERIHGFRLHDDGTVYSKYIEDIGRD